MTSQHEIEHKIKILVAEDDESTRMLYDKALSDEFFEKKFAEDGEKAIELYDSWAPDVIVLDIYLPLMTGYTVLKEIREEDGDNDVAIIIATSLKHEEHVKDCIKFGIQGYITKPFKFRKLGRKIMQYYQRHGRLSYIDAMREAQKSEKER